MSSEKRKSTDLEKEHQSEPSTEDTDRPRIISSHDLLQNRSEVWIEHGNDMYRLRLTASGKLYLTK